jgi:citrate synthase
LSHAAQMNYMFHGIDPDETSARILDLTLVLYAEHDFNASTFTNRVVASTASDMTSATVSAIGALKGPLHGGANEESLEMILKFKSAAEAGQWVRQAWKRKSRGRPCLNRRPPGHHPRTRNAQAGQAQKPRRFGGHLRRDQRPHRQPR